MNYSSYILLIPLLPLLGFVVLGIYGKKYFNKTAGLIATLFLLTSTLLSLYTAYHYFFVTGIVNGSYPTVQAFNMSWLKFSDDMAINLGIILDPISVMMLVVVSFVSLMVHIFSLGYMRGEERFATYYAFLQFFTFSMLGLVVAINIFQMYMFWELVGVSSYLLIGYYFQKPSAVAASKKAFIVTRFADLGFLIGILIFAFQGNTLDFNILIERLTNIQSSQYIVISSASFMGLSLLTWALTLVFIGGAGKSAMFPLHIWLPDAMEGPTPGSALIHAATMVVAGVYLVARMFPLFQLDVIALHIVTYVGIFSALFAAIIACTQTDIKRVLAYSTMSQIGYMMFALGISGYEGENGLGYTASMFHLFTHAFFKSLLFLGAGAVIHFIHSNEMKDMGGLRKYMPITHFTFFVACLAISGIPPFAGFFSKEEILLAAFDANKLVYVIALITSGITAFYMFRLYFSIFWKKEKHVEHHHAEGSLSMKLPLIILGICTLFVGFIPFSKFVTAESKSFNTSFHLLFSILPVMLAIIGICLAYVLYKTENNKADKLAASLSNVYKTIYHKFYIDEVYLFITKKIIFNCIAKPAAWFDRNIIDASVVASGTVTTKISSSIKGFQSGKVQQYALYFFVGVISLAVIFFVFMLKNYD